MSEVILHICIFIRPLKFEKLKYASLSATVLDLGFLLLLELILLSSSELWDLITQKAREHKPLAAVGRRIHAAQAANEKLERDIKRNEREATLTSGSGAIR